MSMYPCGEVLCRTSPNYGLHKNRNGRAYVPLFWVEDFSRSDRRPAYNLAIALKSCRDWGGRIVAADGRVVRPYSPSDDAKANGNTLSDFPQEITREEQIARMNDDFAQDNKAFADWEVRAARFESWQAANCCPKLLAENQAKRAAEKGVQA